MMAPDNLSSMRTTPTWARRRSPSPAPRPPFAPRIQMAMMTHCIQIGNDLNDGTGQSVVYADNADLGATPIALTGTKAAFRTTDPDGNDDTLHSVQSVITGNYVHIVASRDQTTGQKNIYINGVLDISDFASTESLTGAGYVSIGGEGGSAYNGLVDDVQIYSGVLSGSEVANLYAHPGFTAPNVSVNSSEHLIVARYDFEDTNSPGADSSGRGNEIGR